MYTKFKCKFCIIEQYVEELDLKRKQLETIISAQEMSPEQQKEIESRVVTLQNEIHQLNDEKVIYQQEKDKVDLELFAVRKIVSLYFLFTVSMFFSNYVTKKLNLHFNMCTVYESSAGL